MSENPSSSSFPFQSSMMKTVQGSSVTSLMMSMQRRWPSPCLLSGSLWLKVCFVLQPDLEDLEVLEDPVHPERCKDRNKKNLTKTEPRFIRRSSPYLLSFRTLEVQTHVPLRRRRRDTVWESKRLKWKRPKFSDTREQKCRCMIEYKMSGLTFGPGGPGGPGRPWGQR